MQGNELRKKFLTYFASKGHTIVPSASLVPHDDPSLLFTNAGMVQFKDVFLGLETRAYRRAATAQKCVRAGGKHNDLDTVGRTARHHTFFEMMGNFSFGDYFKKEAIAYAWEFLTAIISLPKDKLWITIYVDDDEAFKLWQDVAGVPSDRIVRLGEKDNFWSMGDTGPCGPCSEIIIDRGEKHRCTAPACGIGKCDCDRWLEIWNLVFMQYDRDSSGKLTPLPRPSIDTGMGLERVSSVLQGVASNYDTDLIKPLINKVEEITGKPYYADERGFPFRVIADHARSCTFLIADGVLPSNDGRGYVLRRILRRAVRFGKVLGIDSPFLFAMVAVVVQIMGDAYPEIIAKQEQIKKVIRIEEERFRETLSEGMKVVNEIITRIRAEGGNIIPGREAFILYDTYGFPLDLTEDIAEEHNLLVDKEAFAAAMEEQRKRARDAREDSKTRDLTLTLGNLLNNVKPTQFVGYEHLELEARVEALIVANERVANVSQAQEAYLIVNATPFYPESGGQVGDTGYWQAANGRGRIQDTRKLPDGKIYHLLAVTSGLLAEGDKVLLRVEGMRRRAIARNHSATHLLHKALQEILGAHAQQAGSLVAPERLRFDFTHFAALNELELKKIEQRVNENVLAGLPVETMETSFDKAREMGATALFGEKYGDHVRVVKMGAYSMELCGGTHVNTTSVIGVFKILSEGGIGAGLRRIEAVTGTTALEHIDSEKNSLVKAAEILKTTPQQLVAKVEALVHELKEKERHIEKLSAELAAYEIDNLMKDVQDVKGVPVLTSAVQVADMEALRARADLLKAKMGSGVIVLASPAQGKVNFVAMVTKDLLATGLHAGNIIKEVAKIAGGSGGGRPDMAQAGGKDVAKLPEALRYTVNVVRQQLK